MIRLTDTALAGIRADSEQGVAPGMGDVQLMVNEIARLKADNEKLQMFGNEMLGCVFEGGALDGGDIAIIGARCGVLTVRDVEAPCGEVCACDEYGFPGECYRKADVMRGSQHG
ncbi:hypothetical protein AABC73_20705 [Pseudomonas sp. G.S.17]|uniref:hypothetical protein n=1 Tax=Pseudomonas sp. G.S.17 TaxID=3137451 RepID=UPI00311C9310